MEVALDDFSSEWNWANTHASSKFEQVHASDYPSLHLYILSKKSRLVCHLNDDGVAAGALEAPDFLHDSNSSNSSEPERWQGRYGLSAVYEDEKGKLRGSIEGSKGNLRVRGKIDISSDKKVSADVGIEGQF
jgi:hypothetical protein